MSEPIPQASISQASETLSTSMPATAVPTAALPGAASSETLSEMTSQPRSHEPRRGRLLVLAGPSGVGKSSVVTALRAALPELYFSVSATTRDPRPGEIDGVHYRFVGPAGFDELIARNELLEWAEIHGGLQRSGTLRAPVEEALRRGDPVLVEVDLQGARAVKKAMPEATTVFLAPPSWDELVRRLRDRGTESPEQFERRLATAKEELAAADEFDVQLVNDDVQKVVRRLIELLVG
ncbi:guanylate kinase [Pseudonocardia thermophila]|jgi:guanylate kinase|uniref:Guanylate kinase n=1 Tax=Pseudonocardia thermophila TaxID=1848 RepID=A0A1M6NBB7_PSETH|nr:guanylate kinase [Pseudonocardia thermophila]SHJ93028.1 guanylate kinase [Pseudonocardia thermophila]